MAYIAITDAEIEVGQPTKKELFDKVQDNFIDHETRIATNEASLASFRPMVFDIKGDAVIQDQVAVERINFGIDILSARIMIVDTGGSGTIEVDIEKSTNSGGAWASIFTTKPSLTSAAAAFDLSTNQVLNAAPVSFATGDLLRVNIDSIMAGLDHFQVIVEFEVS
jgi:hypothetical protein